jgi:hypothetical protein
MGRVDIAVVEICSVRCWPGGECEKGLALCSGGAGDCCSAAGSGIASGVG